MLQKLKVECGHNTVSKLETMFKDIKMSKKIVEDFREGYDNSNMVENIEFSVEILTSGHWPYQESPTYKLPKQMENITFRFQNFYNKKFKNRKMIWLSNHGKVQLQTTYLSKNYQIIANCFQTAIFMLFNENEILTYQEVKDRCHLTDADLTGALLKLCNPKMKLI